MKSESIDGGAYGLSEGITSAFSGRDLQKQQRPKLGMLAPGKNTSDGCKIISVRS
jgi:hypothetical protein